MVNIYTYFSSGLTLTTHLPCPGSGWVWPRRPAPRATRASSWSWWWRSWGTGYRLSSVLTGPTWVSLCPTVSTLWTVSPDSPPRTNQPYSLTASGPRRLPSSLSSPASSGWWTWRTVLTCSTGSRAFISAGKPSPAILEWSDLYILQAWSVGESWQSAVPLQSDGRTVQYQQTSPCIHWDRDLQSHSKLRSQYIIVVVQCSI